MEKFKCPNCKNKIPFNEVFQFKKGHQTICSNCNTSLRPKKVKSWNWGFFIGFLARYDLPRTSESNGDS